jgi:hypothetical protein
MSFNPGLNLIIGSSGTGKTFIFEAIDFMLGAKDGLRRIPEAEGYARVSLSIDPSEGSPFTLRRAFDGGNFEMVEFGNGRSDSETATKRLSSTHSAESNTSLSAFLLDIVGIGNRQVRKNVQGEKKALSFRHVARLALVDEQRMIQQSSPVLSEHDTENTAEANVFAYFLSGLDDSAIIPQENSKNRKARLAAEADLLEAILEERRNELTKLASDPNELVNQATRLESAINDATTFVVSSQAQITELEGRRTSFISERSKRNSRLLFLQEQLKRLRLLDEYYLSDRARLEAVIEASHVFHDLPEGTCPLCNQAFPPETANAPPHRAFEAACSKEIEKIDALRRDLESAISDFSLEESDHLAKVKEIEDQLQTLERELQTVLLPTTGTAHADLQRLLQTRAAVSQGVSIQATILDLENRLSRIRQAQNERVPRPTFEPRATTSSASEFCKVVEEILGAWNYPELGTVAFDTDKCDLVIGGKDRANTGKGYRAITHAAFTIGIMKYCRQKGLPHPGFVVLDTPVNPYKGPASSAPDDQLTDVVKDAFFRYLADDKSGDQIIVIENETPPQDVVERVNVYDFTRNHDIGRYGFFPLRQT